MQQHSHNSCCNRSTNQQWIDKQNSIMFYDKDPFRERKSIRSCTNYDTMRKQFCPNKRSSDPMRYKFPMSGYSTAHSNEIAQMFGSIDRDEIKSSNSISTVLSSLSKSSIVKLSSKTLTSQIRLKRTRSIMHVSGSRNIERHSKTSYTCVKVKSRSSESLTIDPEQRKVYRQMGMEDCCPKASYTISRHRLPQSRLSLYDHFYDNHKISTCPRKIDFVANKHAARRDCITENELEYVVLPVNTHIQLHSPTHPYKHNSFDATQSNEANVSKYKNKYSAEISHDMLGNKNKQVAKKKTKLVIGIRVQKPRVRYTMSEGEKAKQSHKSPFLQRCMCSLKLFINSNTSTENKTQSITESSNFHRDPSRYPSVKTGSKMQKEIVGNVQNSISKMSSSKKHKRSSNSHQNSSRGIVARTRPTIRKKSVASIHNRCPSIKLSIKKHKSSDLLENSNMRNHHGDGLFYKKFSKKYKDKQEHKAKLRKKSKSKIELLKRGRKSKYDEDSHKTTAMVKVSKNPRSHEEFKKTSSFCKNVARKCQSDKQSQNMNSSRYQSSRKYQQSSKGYYECHRRNKFTTLHCSDDYVRPSIKAKKVKFDIDQKPDPNSRKKTWFKLSNTALHECVPTTNIKRNPGFVNECTISQNALTDAIEQEIRLKKDLVNQYVLTDVYKNDMQTQKKELVDQYALTDTKNSDVMKAKDFVNQYALTDASKTDITQVKDLVNQYALTDINKIDMTQDRGLVIQHVLTNTNTVMMQDKDLVNQYALTDINRIDMNEDENIFNQYNVKNAIKQSKKYYRPGRPKFLYSKPEFSQQLDSNNIFQQIKLHISRCSSKLSFKSNSTKAPSKKKYKKYKANCNNAISYCSDTQTDNACGVYCDVGYQDSKPKKGLYLQKTARAREEKRKAKKHPKIKKSKEKKPPITMSCCYETPICEQCDITASANISCISSTQSERICESPSNLKFVPSRIKVPQMTCNNSTQRSRPSVSFSNVTVIEDKFPICPKCESYTWLDKAKAYVDYLKRLKTQASACQSCNAKPKDEISESCVNYVEQQQRGEEMRSSRKTMKEHPSCTEETGPIDKKKRKKEEKRRKRKEEKEKTKSVGFFKLIVNPRRKAPYCGQPPIPTCPPPVPTCPPPIPTCPRPIPRPIPSCNKPPKDVHKNRPGQIKLVMTPRREVPCGSPPIPTCQPPVPTCPPPIPTCPPPVPSSTVPPPCDKKTSKKKAKICPKTAKDLKTKKCIPPPTTSKKDVKPDPTVTKESIKTKCNRQKHKCRICNKTNPVRTRSSNTSMNKVSIKVPENRRRKRQIFGRKKKEKKPNLNPCEEYKKCEKPKLPCEIIRDSHKHSLQGQNVNESKGLKAPCEVKPHGAFINMKERLKMLFKRDTCAKTCQCHKSRRHAPGRKSINKTNEANLPYSNTHTYKTKSPDRGVYRYDECYTIAMGKEPCSKLYRMFPTLYPFIMCYFNMIKTGIRVSAFLFVMLTWVPFLMLMRLIMCWTL